MGQSTREQQTTTTNIRNEGEWEEFQSGSKKKQTKTKNQILINPLW